MAAALGALAAVATGVCAVSLVVVHLLPTGYDPVRDAVSYYGVGRYRVWYRTAAVALGSAGILLAAALARAVDPTPKAVIALLVAFGLARIAIAAFPADLDRSSPTRTGRIHFVLAVVAFGTIAFAAPRLHRAVGGDLAWAGIAGLLAWLGWAVTAAAAATVLALRARALRPWFGLVERCLYVAMIAWFLTVGLHLA